jgi:hypothetical protein
MITSRQGFLSVSSGVARFFLLRTCQNGKNVPNDHTLYQTAIKYTKWPQNIPNGHKLYQHFTSLGTLKYTQIWIFGLKINHLATLASRKAVEKVR